MYMIQPLINNVSTAEQPFLKPCLASYDCYIIISGISVSLIICQRSFYYAEVWLSAHSSGLLLEL